MLLNVRMDNEKFLLLTLWREVNEAYCEKKPQEVILIARATYNLLNLHEVKIIAFLHHLKERSDLLLKDWSQTASGIWLDFLWEILTFQLSKK